MTSAERRKNRFSVKSPVRCNSIKYLRNATRSWASNEQSIMNFGDGHSALVTCCIVGVDVE